MAAVQNLKTTLAVTVSSGADGLSTGYFIGGYRLLGMVNASTWTTAGLTFLGGASSSATFYPLYTSTGGEIAAVTTGLHAMGLADDVSRQLSAYPWIKLRSGTIGAAVVQATTASFTLLLGHW